MEQPKIYMATPWPSQGHEPLVLHLRAAAVGCAVLCTLPCISVGLLLLLFLRPSSCCFLPCGLLALSSARCPALPSSEPDQHELICLSTFPEFSPKGPLWPPPAKVAPLFQFESPLTAFPLPCGVYHTGKNQFIVESSLPVPGCTSDIYLPFSSFLELVVRTRLLMQET